MVLLDDNDGDSVSKTMSLGSRKIAFEGIKTGTEVTIQLAIVVDTAEGDYLISDILEQSINQSLTAPAFSGPWHRMRTGGTSLRVTLGGTNVAIHPDIRFKGLKEDGANPLTGAEQCVSSWSSVTHSGRLGYKAKREPFRMRGFSVAWLLASPAHGPGVARPRSAVRSCRA